MISSIKNEVTINRNDILEYKEGIFLNNYLGDDAVFYLFYFASSIFWRGTLEWREYTKYDLPSSVTDSMKSFLLKKAKFIYGYKINIDFTSKHHKNIKFPFKLKTLNSARLYTFQIFDLIFTLELLDYQINDYKDLLFVGWNDGMTDKYFELFVNRYRDINM